jgi:hypothetical protein
MGFRYEKITFYVCQMTITIGKQEDNQKDKIKSFFFFFFDKLKILL